MAVILLVVSYIVRLVVAQLGGPTFIVQLVGLVLLLIFILYALRILEFAVNGFP